MELRVLKYFILIADEQNISRAASIIHITQPTLSRQIMDLEYELGVTLFERGKKNRNLILTQDGRRFYNYAKEIVNLSERTIEEFKSCKEEVSGVISIGSGGLNSSWMLIEALAGFKKKYPKVTFRFYTNSAQYIKEQLEHGLLDFGLLLEPVDITRFDYIRMNKKERWGVLLRSGHPLAKKEYITKEDLSGESLILTERPSLQKELENWMGKKLSDLDIFATYNIITNVAMMVDIGLASAITLEEAVNLFGSERLVFRPLYPELIMSSVFAWRKSPLGYSAAGLFLEYIKLCVKGIEKYKI